MVSSFFYGILSSLTHLQKEMPFYKLKRRGLHGRNPRHGHTRSSGAHSRDTCLVPILPYPEPSPLPATHFLFKPAPPLMTLKTTP